MSKTFSLCCKNCKKRLWIAKEIQSNEFVKTFPGSPENIYKFLFEHLGHSLEFVDCTSKNYHRYKTINDENINKALKTKKYKQLDLFDEKR